MEPRSRSLRSPRPSVSLGRRELGEAPSLNFPLLPRPPPPTPPFPLPPPQATIQVPLSVRPCLPEDMSLEVAEMEDMHHGTIPFQLPAHGPRLRSRAYGHA